MKGLNSHIIQNNNIVIEAEYLSMSIENKEYGINLNFQKTKILDNIELGLGTPLAIQIYLNETQVDKIHLIATSIEAENDNLNILAKFDDNKVSYFREYSSKVYDIFIKWRNNFDIDWRSFKTTEKKIGWIRACNRKNGLQAITSEGEKFHLDCTEIKSKIDFFCYIGEVLFGKTGYMGSFETEFEDCLIYICHANPRHRSTIVIHNFESLEKLNERNFVSDFKNRFLERMRESDFNIIFN